MNYRLICHNIILIILLLTLTHTFPFGAVSKSQYQYEYLQFDGLHQQADGKPKQTENRTAKTIKQRIVFAVNAKQFLQRFLAMRMQSGSATFALVNLNMTCSSRCYKGPSGVTALYSPYRTSLLVLHQFGFEAAETLANNSKQQQQQPRRVFHAHRQHAMQEREKHDKDKRRQIQHVSWVSQEKGNERETEWMRSDCEWEREKQAGKMKLLSTEISALHKAKTHEMQKVFALCFKLNFQIVDDISELLFLLPLLLLLLLFVVR